ncbi:ABC transporter substrate-binding protein [Pseudophaeobacter arcticus]|jgi:iron(III) transport system substrate-binding protein|uniref:ABC transporter substrate-binding protein n=1 Tax=Pseudophaeobacter arcticus TaxID=385492 RepID=UPI0003FDA561|nr:ABC transporter substrate-binding protein [Pseudophaeobacter arcticus]
MRYILALILSLLPLLACAQDREAQNRDTWEDRAMFQGSASRQTLRILSSTDRSFFAPIITSFLAQRPELAIEYLVSGTAEVDRIFRQDPSQFDLVISSAMDLQFKAANDGLALPIEDVTTPDWAQWRQSLFAFTTEPAAIVIRRADFAGHPLPQTRQDLIQALRARPEVFRNRLGSYDIRQSGLGYLFATQDARASETYWRLMEVMGNLGTRLYCCSGDMITDLQNGELAVAYNVLGSYASARTKNSDDLAVILPADFPITMMRTGFVSAMTTQPEHAGDFIRHLLDIQSAPLDPQVFPLPPLIPASGSQPQFAITLDPALMTYLDRLKRRTFLKEWVSAVIQ